MPTLQILVRLEDGYEGRPGRRRVRGLFEYGGSRYILSITDPEIEEQFLVRGNGEYELRNVALCLSLAEVWNGFAFRLIASVITEERCR